MTPDVRDRSVQQVKADVQRLLARPLADADLRAHLEELARQWAFSGLTWLWGPELYRRNRVLFRPFILGHFGTTQILPGWRWKQIEWKGHTGEILERWLAEVDRNDDVELFRRLYQWKIDNRARDRKHGERILPDLLRRFDAAPGPAARAVVLSKFNFFLELDEMTAIRLYQKDAATTTPFILTHMPMRGGWTGNKCTFWETLFKLAQERGDQAFALRIYRRQAPLDQWEKDALQLCRSISDPATLCGQLEERHPEGWGLDLGVTVEHLIAARGRDVVPYVLKHMKEVWLSWDARGGYRQPLDMAYANGWWDLWSGLLRVSAPPKDWNKVVLDLVQDQTLNETEVVRRLLLLTGISREWNFGGFGLAQVQQLDDPTATALYDRFPHLVRGPFKLHLQTGFWSSLPGLIRRVLERQDETMIDFLASRLVNRRNYGYGAAKPLEDLEPLADYFQVLRERDPAEFARRAANVLTLVPAYTFWSYGRTIHDNRLARLLLERSLDSFLGDAAALRDLVEASEIHVQQLAYRVLGLDDDRARAAAAANLDILIGTLLRPLQRSTRLAAFKALANAAAFSKDNAGQVLERARDAFQLPDKKYPKEKLVSLIGEVLNRWPELRSAAEQPVVYRRREVAI
jgi:hypothetical protein